MLVNKEEVTKILHLKRSGNRGWFMGNCVYCGKEGHLSVIFGTVSSFDCKKCGRHGTLYDLLRYIKRFDLLTLHKNVNLEEPFKKLSIQSVEQEINYNIPVHSLPIGWKQIYHHDYLEKRGWDKEDYFRYPVGVTKLDPKLKNDYVVFACLDSTIDDKEINIGYVSRSVKSKEWIKQFNEDLPAGRRKYLRYINSENTDFSKYLYGCNEITEKTLIVIIVEGIFDKFNVDKKLKLFESEEVKCVCTFGKKISIEQIKRLQDKKIENIILLYDPDAVKSSKEYSLSLNNYFNVQVGYISYLNEMGESKDPGDLEEEELLSVLENTEDVVSFYLSKIEKRKLL